MILKGLGDVTEQLSTKVSHLFHLFRPPLYILNLLNFKSRLFNMMFPHFNFAADYRTSRLFYPLMVLPIKP